MQRDSTLTKYDYFPFPTPSAEELRTAIENKIGKDFRVRKEDFPPPTVAEIEQAVERYGEWWGRSTRFWLFPCKSGDVGFYKRMRSATLTASDVGKLAAELDLSCNSGPAPLIYSPPIDVSEFNEAFMAIGGKGLLEDAVRDLYGNNRVVDVHHFPRRLLHSVMYSLVTTEPVNDFRGRLRPKLAEITKRRALPFSEEEWKLSDALLSPLGRGC